MRFALAEPKLELELRFVADSLAWEAFNEMLRNLFLAPARPIDCNRTPLTCCCCTQVKHMHLCLYLYLAVLQVKACRYGAQVLHTPLVSSPAQFETQLQPPLATLCCLLLEMLPHERSASLFLEAAENSSSSSQRYKVFRLGSRQSER